MRATSAARQPGPIPRPNWIDHEGELPLIEGTLIRLKVDHLPGGDDPLPVWLWSSRTGMTGADVDLRWQAFLRHFDLEHTFRMIKQTLGSTRPKLRTPEAADPWTWLIITAHTPPPRPVGQAPRKHRRTRPGRTIKNKVSTCS